MWTYLQVVLASVAFLFFGYLGLRVYKSAPLFKTKMRAQNPGLGHHEQRHQLRRASTTASSAMSLHTPNGGGEKSIHLAFELLAKLEGRLEGVEARAEAAADDDLRVSSQSCLLECEMTMLMNNDNDDYCGRCHIQTLLQASI